VSFIQIGVVILQTLGLIKMKTGGELQICQNVEMLKPVQDLKLLLLIITYQLSIPETM